ncbi:MAG: PepSY domain-containing protein [Bacteroidota bacterium]
MIVNIWRYSHFALAVSSSLFVLLAAVTGLILAFEPIQEKLQPFQVANGEQTPLSELIDSLENRYDEVLELAVDANYFVKASVISMDEATDGDFYINPSTGEKLADIPDKNPFFEWVTNLHRSLFLKTWGRIFVGITSFLLFLIALTGSILLIKRQSGIRHFFAKIVKEDFAQYYHIILGRLSLLPILIITLTGVYLSLFRFSLIPESTGQSNTFEAPATPLPERPFSEFAIFQTTQLKDIRKLEFPFSDDAEEFFTLTLQDKTLSIHQKTGAIVSEVKSPFVELLTRWNFNLHTGTGSFWWSIVLAIASFNILFFLYSGSVISYRRIRSKIKNKYGKEEAEIVVLIGTENGSTRAFAGVLQKALFRLRKKVFIDDLNHYQAYPRLKHLVVLTSTYGDGDPPANATRFLKLLTENPPAKTFQYSVVGFGSMAYPHFCQFALDVDAALSTTPNANQAAPIALVNNKSYESFKQWAQDWGAVAAPKLQLPAEMKQKKEKEYPFQVVEKTTVIDDYDETFVLKLQPPRHLKFRSGDLLAVYPPTDPVERLYSIGKSSSGQILLSIKKHELGVCSNYLNDQQHNALLQAALRTNPSFHPPKKASSLTLISNGTGIAPFLGMLQEVDNIPTYLYWGGRSFQSYELYQPLLETSANHGATRAIKTAFSKEDNADKYVQDLLKKDGTQVAERLQSGGVVMICGSISMQNDVLELLEQISQQHLHQPLDVFVDRGQILMDCY